MESRDDAAERRSVAYVEKMAELRADEVRRRRTTRSDWLGAHTAQKLGGPTSETPAWLVDVLTRCEAEGGLDCPGCGQVTLAAEYAPTFAEWVWDWTRRSRSDCRSRR